MTIIAAHDHDWPGGTMIKHRLYVVFTLLLLCVLVSAGLAQSAQIVATITVDEPTKEAEVGPGQSGLVQFTGRVTCDGIGVGNNVQRILLSLRVEAGNWSAAVTPTTVVFAPTDTEKPFTLSVRAPPRESWTSFQEVTITGTATPVPGLLPVDVNPTHVTVYVKQFYDVMLESTSPYIELSPGKTGSFELRVHNQGNGFDSFSIDVLNQKSLADQGWVVQIGSSSVDVQERSMQTVKISVTTPTKWTIWKNEISSLQIQVTSQGSQMAGGFVQDEDYPLYCRDKGMYIPGFDAQLVIFAGAIVILGFAYRRRRG